MKLWISKSSEVPIQEQLTTQLILGIVSGDLASEERLPSTTQIARRFNLHANTVRAAYRELADRGWAEWKTGSGFYVRALASQPKLDPRLDLDHLISTFLSIARGRGHSLEEIQARVKHWFSRQRPERVLVIEADSDLRNLMVSEIQERSELPVAGIGLEDAKNSQALVGSLSVALYDHAPGVQNVLLLHSRSIAKSLDGRSRPSPDTLITVISSWAQFLQWARTTLVAVGVDPNAIDLRDAEKKGWERGLTKKSFIIADSLAARRLPKDWQPIVFRVVADESLAELQQALDL
jgi:DNA-binding transcriptional regulator YhcF (GntR family)